MSQQINLFNPLFLKKKRYFSFATMAQSLGVLLLGLAAFYGYARYQETLLEAEGRTASTAFEAEKARLSKFTAEFAPGKAQNDMDKAIATAKTDIAARQALLVQMQSGVLGNTRGYSQYLTAFARRTQPGVWLTNIQIGPGDDKLSIAGRALQGEQVSILLSQYKLEPALKGRPFGALTITRQEASPGTGGRADLPGYVEFVLSSGMIEKETPAVDDDAGAKAGAPSAAASGAG